MARGEFLADVLRKVKEVGISIVAEAFVDMAELFAVRVIKVDRHHLDRVTLRV
jgi:hypothetical protein